MQAIVSAIGQGNKKWSSAGSPAQYFDGGDAYGRIQLIQMPDRLTPGICKTLGH